MWSRRETPGSLRVTPMRRLQCCMGMFGDGSGFIMLRLYTFAESARFSPKFIIKSSIPSASMTLRCQPKISRGVGDGCDDAGADGVVAKAFIFFAVFRPASNEVFQYGIAFFGGDVFSIEARDACAFAVAADVEVVASGGFADESDFCQHGASAAVRTAVDAQDDVFVRKVVGGHDGVHFVDVAGQQAFGFCHGERTGGQCDARHGMFALRAVAVLDESVRSRDAFDFGFVFAGDVRYDEVLVGGEAEVALVDFGNFAHAGF